MFRRFVAVFLLAHPFLSSVFAERSDVDYVPSRSYFATVQREIEGAKTSISVYLYLFSFQPNESQSDVFQLAQSLKKAHDTGVKVEVVLDQNIDYPGQEGAPVEAKNLAAYVFLRKSGIPVYFDDAATYTHAKAIVIDEETVIVGSSNWSRAAFEVNEETNVLIRSKRVAGDMLNALRAIPREAPVDNGPSVPLPTGFLLNNALFGQMVTRSDERAFDVYLFLLWKNAGKFVLDYGALAAHLGIDGMGPEAYRRQINKALGKLEDRYRLVSVSKKFGQEAEITLPPLSSQEGVPISVAYWDLGWNRRLSFAGKAFYLINLREASDSPLQPRWTQNLQTLGKRYGASPWFISQGVTDLRRNNLLEVEYGAAGPKGPGDRAPNVYTPNPFYDPKELDQSLENLKIQYGADKLERARRAASLVYEDSYLHGIIELIELEDKYGPERIARAAKILGAKSPDNPKRTIGYFIATIRGLD